MDGNNERGGASSGSHFHSTIMQRPQGEDDPRDRHPQKRDVLNPVPGGAHHPAGFSLRSPTRTELRPPTFGSPSANHSTPSAPHHSPPRSSMSAANASPFAASSSASSGAQGPSGGPVAPALPPPVLGPSPSNSHAGLPASPLHPPAGYYPPPRSSGAGDGRDKPSATTSFYDPTTDTTKERRVSESSWANAPQQATTPKVSCPTSFDKCPSQKSRLFYFSLA